MLGRRSATKRTLAAALAAVAISGACRDKAVTGPNQTQGKDYAANLRSIGGDQQIGSVAVPLGQQLIVKVVDAGGQPVQGATVNFSVRGGGGSINPPANVSGADGLVKATWTLGTTLGANKAVAILSSSFILDSAVFNATATAGAPAIITVTGGDAQTARVSRTLPTPLSIKVVDQFGYAVSGRKVTWATLANSGTVVANSDTTAADGTATAVWTLGTVNGPQFATATVLGLTQKVFSVTTQVDTGRTITVASTATPAGGISQALPSVVSVKVVDNWGNNVVGDTVFFGDSLTGGGSVSPRAVATDATGIAQSTWTLGAIAGAQLQRIRLTAAKRVSLTATARVTFAEVVAGNFQTCGVSQTNNRVFCWGAGDAGQLGKGSLAASNAPTAAVPQGGDTLIGPFLQARQVAAGRNAFCTLSTARQMWCWGRYLAAPVAQASAFQSVVNGDKGQQILINSIALGQQHTCLQDLGGNAFCTGPNYFGELGNGGVSPQTNSYTFVTGAGATAVWAVVRAGTTHSCGMLRLDPANANFTRTPFCWGQNNAGQVGNGNPATAFDGSNVQTAVQVTIPVQADAPTAFDSTTLTTGGQHTCIAEATAPVPSTTPGRAWCWGNNAYGQLGTAITATAAARDSIMRPVSGTLTFARLYAGEYHTCGISTAGDAYCWGRNDYGQMGDGSRTNKTFPVLVLGGLKFRSLSLGELHTCGVVGNLSDPVLPSAAAGTIYCWGDNSFGQIGIAATASGNAPVLVPTKVANQP